MTFPIFSDNSDPKHVTDEKLYLNPHQESGCFNTTKVFERGKYIVAEGDIFGKIIS